LATIHRIFLENYQVTIEERVREYEQPQHKGEDILLRSIKIISRETKIEF
jgi:hypothetical protein